MLRVSILLARTNADATVGILEMEKCVQVQQYYTKQTKKAFVLRDFYASVNSRVCSPMEKVDRSGKKYNKKTARAKFNNSDRKKEQGGSDCKK